MEPDPKAIQAGYDLAAEAYARQYFDELNHKPLDRSYLDRFVSELKTIDPGGRLPVCDMGCGPGEVARYLYDHGLGEQQRPVWGVDLSPGMVRQASQLSPMIHFQTGDMLCLNVPDASWAGIAAFYSIIHIQRPKVVDALRELKRVLVPGGLLLMSIHIYEGQEIVHVEEFYGNQVSMDWVFYQVEDIQKKLESAGFERIEVFERAPYPDVEYQGPRAYFFARKPL